MRTFVAINPPAPVRADLHSASDVLRDSALPVRWLPAENLHITLKFLGEVEEDRVPELRRSLDRAVSGFEPFDLEVAELGAFPSMSRPRVLWVGVEGDATLQSLQERVEGEMEALGFDPEDRDFHAHMTLGRTRSRPDRAQLRELDRLARRVRFEGRFQVRAVDLMRSQLRPTGAVYDVVYSSSFGEGSAD